MTAEALPENQGIRLAIINQQEGVKLFLQAANKEEELLTLKAELVTVGRTNYQISQLIHAHFGVALEPDSKMSPSYHIHVPRLLRRQLFLTGDERVTAWQKSLAKRKGVEHPRSKINIDLPEFDQIINTIRTNRLNGLGYPEIRTLLEGYSYPVPLSMWSVVHSNPDIFPELIEYDKDHKTTVRARMLVRHQQARVKVLSLIALEDESKLEELRSQIELIEELRIDKKLTWDEINLRLGESTGKGAYKEWKQLRKRVKRFMDLGHFTRLTPDVERALQDDQTAESHRRQSLKFRKFSPEREREIYDLWLEARKKGGTLTAFAKELGVNVKPIRKIIKRLDEEDN